MSGAKHDWEFHVNAMHAIFQDQGEDGVQRYWKRNRLSRFVNTTCAEWMRENWAYLIMSGMPQLSDADFVERLLDLHVSGEHQLCRLMWLRRGGQRTFGQPLRELLLMGMIQRDRGLKISDLQLVAAEMPEAPEPDAETQDQSAHPDPPENLRALFGLLGEVWDDDERRQA